MADQVHVTMQFWLWIIVCSLKNITLTVVKAADNSSVASDPAFSN